MSVKVYKKQPSETEVQLQELTEKNKELEELLNIIMGEEGDA
jgi:hypothetical protein